MKTTKFNYFLILSTILLFNACKSNSQGFQGKLIYKMSIEKPENSTIPDETFKMMFNGVDEDTTTVYYLKNDYFKMETLDAKTNKPKTVLLYDPKAKKSYAYIGGQEEFCMWSDANSNNQPTPIITQNLNDKIILIGKKCNSITIDYGIMSKNKLYFPVDEKIDLDALGKGVYGFYGYISESGAVPYKIIMSGNGAVQNLVYTLKEVIREELNNEIFEVPKFKQMMKSPFFQK